MNDLILIFKLYLHSIIYYIDQILKAIIKQCSWSWNFHVLFQGCSAKLIRAFIFQKHFYLLKFNMQIVLVPIWELFNRLQYKFHWRVHTLQRLKKEVQMYLLMVFGGQFFMLNFLTPSFTFSIPCGNLPQGPPPFLFQCHLLDYI